MFISLLITSRKGGKISFGGKETVFQKSASQFFNNSIMLITSLIILRKSYGVFNTTFRSADLILYL